MTINFVLATIGFVLAFIGFIGAVLCGNDLGLDNNLDLIVCFLCVIVGLGLFIFFGIKDRYEEKDLISKEYTIYLDGVRVDNDKIDISLYNYTVDDEKQVVYITRR